MPCSVTVARTHLDAQNSEALVGFLRRLLLLERWQRVNGVTHGRVSRVLSASGELRELAPSCSGHSHTVRLVSTVFRHQQRTRYIGCAPAVFPDVSGVGKPDVSADPVCVSNVAGGAATCSPTLSFDVDGAVPASASVSREAWVEGSSGWLNATRPLPTGRRRPQLLSNLCDNLFAAAAATADLRLASLRFLARSLRSHCLTD